MIGVGTTIFLVNPTTFPSGVTYLLDTYSAPIAYSLRQLKTGVTNVVRVRRSSDSAESDFTATEITDGTLTTWTGANDGFVTKLYNQGTDGASYDMEQTTAANQPRLVSSGVVDTKNGLPAMYFDGSNDVLLSATSYSTSKDTYPYTQFALASNEASGDPGVAFSHRESSGDLEGWIIQFDRSSTTQYVFDLGASVPIFDYLASDNTNSQRLQTFNIDLSGNGETWLNGTSQETQSTLSQVTLDTAKPIYFGGMQTSSLRFTGYIQEFIFYTTDEDANRTSIESDINTYYSIY